MPRLLLIGSNASGVLERFYERAFRRLGVEVFSFDPDAWLRPIRHSRIVNRITWEQQYRVAEFAVQHYFMNAPSVDAVLVFKGFSLSPAAIEYARRRTRHSRWANINPDSPFDPGRATSNARVRASIPLYDTYFTWSRGLVAPLRAAGAKDVQYLPFGFDEVAHVAPHEVDSSLAKTVTFVGSHDAQRQEVLEAVADLDIRVFGNAWENLPRRSPLRSKIVSSAIYGAELNRVVGSSLASINILRPQNVGSHNMRTFEVPAMGGLMLTSRSSEQEAFFPDRQASLMYDSPEELRRLILELQAGVFQPSLMRAAAHKRAQEHSYLVRAKQVLSHWGIEEGR